VSDKRFFREKQILLADTTKVNPVNKKRSSTSANSSRKHVRQCVNCLQRLANTRRNDRTCKTALDNKARLNDAENTLRQGQI